MEPHPCGHMMLQRSHLPTAAGRERRPDAASSSRSTAPRSAFTPHGATKCARLHRKCSSRLFSSFVTRPAPLSAGSTVQLTRRKSRGLF